MQRTLEPELLDSLSPHHPDAVHNRRDLRLTNLVLGNHRWIARTLPPLLRRGDRTLEIGAGTGELGARLGRRGVRIDGLDLWSRPAVWPAERAWHAADLLSFSGYEGYDAIVGNLIFHQFSNADLAALGDKLRRNARVIVACEPLRRRASQVFYRVFGALIGANHVSLHDAHVSIAAGFRDAELPRGLGLISCDWSITASSSLLGIYRMIAVRQR